MQTLRKKNSPCKYKKEPTRFLGEGVSFKAKLIGILEVSEARGDRMCQAALADLKMAIRAAGEHKQRIAVQVSIDGLRLRDEKTGECLYHHPVHKISFIAQDMSDSRAFGYIFGSPDTGHRFFGIKTDKAANQVVIAMRDLFQVVFELKKKEIELAKQHIEQNAIKFPTSGIFVEPAPDTKGAAGTESCLHRMRSSNADTEKIIDKKSDSRSGVIADLLDLQFELNSLQQGIHQMDKITPENARPSSEDPFETDPFGDSFTNIKVKGPVQPMLPPPPSSAKRGHLERQQTIPTPSSSTSSPATVMPSRTSPPQQSSMRWLENDVEKQFCDGEIANLTSTACADKDAKSDNDSTSSFRIQGKSPQIDVFTELDPLGTGLSKPYIDKKDFFQHLKNPPKKVLKDLVTTSSGDTFPTNFDLSIDSLDPITINNEKSTNMFEDGDFADFDKFETSSEAHNTSSSSSSSKKRSPQLTKKSKVIHHQPLSVSLPPEDPHTTITKNIPTTTIGKVERDNCETIHSLIRLPSPNKQQSLRKKEFDIDLSSTCRGQSIDKSFPVDFSLANESPASPIRSGSSEANSRLSSSSAELEIVPEPPPRGAGSIVINPPPLPPKKQGGRGGNKPPPRPPHSDGHFHYDFVERQTTTPSPTKKDRSIKSPQSNAIRRFDDDFTPMTSNTQESASRIGTINPLSSSRFEDSFSNMIPTTLSSLFKNTYDNGGKVKKKPSLDITLSQLTSSNLTELATNLHMSVNELTSLTLQQLTECLGKLSVKDTQPTPPPLQPPANNITDTSFVLEEPLFTANFQQTRKPNENMNYDKYAVFRELLEMEHVRKDEFKDCIDKDINNFDRKESSSQDDEVYDNDTKIELNIKHDDETLSDINGVNVMNKSMSDEAIGQDAKEDNAIEMAVADAMNFQSLSQNEKIVMKLSNENIEEKNELTKNLNVDVVVQVDTDEAINEFKEDTIAESPPKSDVKSPSIQSNDRYAALRDIAQLTNESEDKPMTPSTSPIELPKPNVAEQDLMKLFSTPPSQISSPKKLNQHNTADLKAIATDIFEEIRMLNTNINNSRLSSSGFEDVFCPFTEINKQTNKDEIKDENWAKFDTGIFHSDKLPYEGHRGSIGGTSPWSPDEKEFHKESSLQTIATATPPQPQPPTTITTVNRHSGDSDNEWKDEEESEESNGRLRDEGFWGGRHPRFDSSCEESIYYDDGTAISDKERHFRERSSRKSRGIPWTKGGHRMRPESPQWHEEERWDEENRRYATRKIPYKDDDERKAHWKCRSGGGVTSQRPHWNGDREGFRPHDHPIYDDERGKRRMMLWSEDERDRDRFSSQESMGYDDEERWSRREYERRRWEEDGRFWSRRGIPPPPDGDYSASYRKHNVHYRRDSRERPSLDYPPGWEEDYAIDRGGENSHRYMSRKRHWPKRPNSANDERSVEVAYAESRIKYGVSRSECSDNDSELYHRPYRSRSREIYWEGDQEFDSWGERPYWSEGPDTKGESLHRRRMNRHKQPMRASVVKPQNSPFEDDFTRSLELGQPSMDSLGTETRMRSQEIVETKQPISPRSNVQDLGRKDMRKYKDSSYFDDDLTPTPSASSDTSDRQRLGPDFKTTLDELPCDMKEPASADGFISEDSGRDSFFNGDPRFDDDAFAIKSEMADCVPETTSGMILKNSRQLKYGNNKIKGAGDHDIKKSESVNIFVRESDPFDDDDFFN